MNKSSLIHGSRRKSNVDLQLSYHKNPLAPSTYAYKHVPCTCRHMLYCANLHSRCLARMKSMAVMKVSYTHTM